MSTSDRAFNQVKAILGKLDRSIDEARSRRTQAVPPPAPTPVPASHPVYGRAQPLNRPGNPGAHRWAK